MLEQNWWFQVVIVNPLIFEKNWHEVAQSYNGHLISIYLSSLNLYEPILCIFLDHELTFSFKQVCDHRPVIWF